MKKHLSAGFPHDPGAVNSAAGFSALCRKDRPIANRIPSHPEIEMRIPSPSQKREKVRMREPWFR